MGMQPEMKIKDGRTLDGQKYRSRPALANQLRLFAWSPNRLRPVRTTWDERGAAREHRGLPARITENPLARGADEPLRVGYPATRGLGCGALSLGRTKHPVGIRWRGETVGVNLGGEVAGRGLVVGGGDVVGTEGGDKAVRRTVVPVQRAGVHGGESKLTGSQAVFISARFHFPELQHRVQQNNKSVVDSISPPFCEASHPL